ncbi:MAG: thioredoxin [Oscillospiraceae bacterium]
MSIKLTTENFESVVLQSDKPVLVDFWATWCGPCKMVGPIIEELSGELEGKVVVGKIDVDEQQDLAMKYQVMSIPTLLVFEKGKEVKRSVGFKPKAQILEMVEGI